MIYLHARSISPVPIADRKEILIMAKGSVRRKARNGTTAFM